MTHESEQAINNRSEAIDVSGHELADAYKTIRNRGGVVTGMKVSSFNNARWVLSVYWTENTTGELGFEASPPVDQHRHTQHADKQSAT